MNNRYLVFVGMGMELLGIIISCVFIGQSLDERWSTKGLFLVILPLFGLAGWIAQIVILSKRIERQESQSDVSLSKKDSE